jgi:tRNA(adenine34) deaminase
MKRQYTAQDVLFMEEAIIEAKKAAQHGDVPVGAVIVLAGQIIGRGHNRREIDSDPTAHAEIIALRDAGAKQGGWRLENAVLYVTLEPCPMCASAIVQARLAQVIYGVDDTRLGACGSLLNLLQFPGFHHDTSIRSGLLAESCRTLLQDFFNEKRAVD